MSKKSFYCWYLGFTEFYSLQGQDRLFEIVQTILKYRNNNGSSSNSSDNLIASSSSSSSPTKITLTLNESSIIIIDNPYLNSNNTNNKKILKKILSHNSQSSKSYVINYDKVTAVVRLKNTIHSDIVACVIKSSVNNKILNLHAFRCDSEETAIKMEQYLNYFRNMFMKRLEKHQLKSNRNPQKVRSRSPPSETAHLHNTKLKNNSNFIQRQIFRMANGFNSRNSSKAARDESTGPSSGMATSIESSHSSQVFPTHDQNHLELNQEAFVYRPSSPGSNEEYHYQNQYNPPSSRPTSPYFKNTQIENINREITEKLQSGQPLLYPPKDYTEADRKRGNLAEAEKRRSLNSSIVGKEGLALRDRFFYSYFNNNSNHINSNINTNNPNNHYQNENVITNHVSPISMTNLNLIDEENVNSYESINENNNINNDQHKIDSLRSEFSSPSFNEQAYQVIKLLDDIVDSHMDEKSSNIPMTQVNQRSSFRVNSNLNKMSSLSSDSINYDNNFGWNQSKNNKNNSSNNKIGSKSMSSGLNEAYFNDVGLLKPNPLHIIDEENSSLINNNINNHINIGSNRFINDLFKNDDNFGHNLKKSDSKKSTSSVGNLNINNRKKIFGSNSSKNSFISENDPVNSGFRNGALTKLGKYQPQWLPGQNREPQPQVSSSDFNHNRELFERLSNNNQRLSTGAYIDENRQYLDTEETNRLRYSESARTSNNNLADMPPKPKLSFLRKGLRRVNENSDAKINYLNSSNSEFILKPVLNNPEENKPIREVYYNGNRKYIKSSFNNHKNIPVDVNQDKINMNFKSDPSLSNISNHVTYTDVYY